MHANIVSLQITDLAIGFILRRFWRGSNTVTASIVLYSSQFTSHHCHTDFQVNQNHSYKIKWDQDENFPGHTYIIYQTRNKLWGKQATSH